MHIGYAAGRVRGGRLTRTRRDGRANFQCRQPDGTRSRAGRPIVMLLAMSRRDQILITHREAIRAAALRHHVRALALVGSVARGEDTEASDCDFLADFLPGASLFDISGLRVELEDLLGGDVDVVYARGVREHCRSMFDDAVPL